MEAAWELLKEQGASGMSVDAVVSRAGLSKGTFFHFFPTKRQFLTALCYRLADVYWEEMAVNPDPVGTDPVSHMNLLFASIRQWRTARSRALGPLWQELVREENAALRSLVVTRWSERLGAALTGLIETGNTGGVMRVSDPEVVGALVAEWIAASTIGSLRLVIEQPSRDAIELAVRRTNVTIESIERVLGLAEQSLSRADPRTVTSLAEAMQQSERASPSRDNPAPASSRRSA